MSKKNTNLPSQKKKPRTPRAIVIKPEEIRKNGGLLSAISYKCAQIVHSTFMKEHPFLPADKLARLERILAHKNPHLDEYMAALLFRACLPPQKSLIPFDEIILSSTNNDQAAKVLFPSSAVFGCTGIHDGGATPLLDYDEHVAEGETKQSTSLSMLVMTTLFPNAEKKQGGILPALLQVVQEVDFIDANGNAHPQHLGNCIKRMHETSLQLSPVFATRKISEIMTPSWKQAVVEASIVSLTLAKNDKQPFQDPEYWRGPALDSLQYYAKHSPLANDTLFHKGVETLQEWINKFRSAKFRLRTDNRKFIYVKAGSQSNQCLIIFYLAALLQQYWGPVLGQILMSHFWETLLRGQMTYFGIQEELEKIIDPSQQHINRRTPYGDITFINTGLMPAGATDNASLPVWILEIVPRQNVADARSPLMSFLNQANEGVGYTLLRTSNAGTNVLSKGKAISQKEWEQLCDRLIATEGCADEEPAGCWHRTYDSRNLLAGFLLNGNPAHQYVPKSQFSAIALSHFLQTM